LLTQLATGIHPFASRSEQQWILRVHSAQPDLLGLSPSLDDMVRWTLAHDPRDRPTARALATICRSHWDAHERPVPRHRREVTTTPPQPIPDTVALATTGGELVLAGLAQAAP